MLNLGDLSFNVTGSTASLQKSVDRIREFGRVVDQVAKSQQEGAQATIKAYVAQERALKSALQQTLNMQQKLKSSGGTPEMLARTSNAFRGLTSALTSGKISSVEFARAQDKFRLIMGQVNRDLAKFNELQPSGGKNGFATFLKDIQSSAVIAAGPLSGVASRIQAVSAMAERSSLSMAAFLGGVTAAAVGLGFLAKAAIEASMKAEQVQAVLQVGSGSATSAAHEFRYVHDEALKLGLSIDSLAMNYANLVAATQNTSLAGEETRKIFESVATASRALRMSHEATTGVFTALTQMVSKGVVYNEELTQQLSERIPGAFKIAADAMGVTTVELKKMMSEGTLLTSNFLPKFADQLQKVFGGGAVAGASSLDASLQNLSTRIFDFNQAFDKSLGVSTAFKSIVDSTAGSIKFLTEHMNEIIGLIGALTGAMSALAVRSLLGLAIPAFTSLVTAVVAATKAIRTAGISLAIFEGIATGGLSTLLTLVATVGSAIAGYYAFKPAAEDAATASNTLSKEMADLVGQTQRNIAVMPELADSIRSRATAEIETLTARIKDLNAEASDTSFTAFLSMVADDWKRSLGMNVTDKKQQINELVELLKKKREELTNFNKAVASTTKPVDPAANLVNDKAAKALQKAMDTITQLRQEADMLASGASDAEVQRATAVQRLTAELTNAKVAQEEVNRVVAIYSNLLTQVSAIKASNKASEQITDLRREAEALANGISPEKFKVSEQIRKFTEDLRDAGVSEGQVAQKTKDFTAALSNLEAQQKSYNQQQEHVKAVNQAMEQSFDAVGDAIVELGRGTKDISEAFNDMVNSIIKDLLRMAVQESITNPLKNAIFGTTASTAAGASTGGSGGILNELLSFLPGRAGGGGVNAGQPYKVGEEGEELFVPQQNGTIVPNNQLASMGGIKVDMHIHTPNAAGFVASRNQVAAKMMDAVRGARGIR